jgi:hypothetical protein
MASASETPANASPVMYCPNCGSSNPIASINCARCGAAIQPPRPNSTSLGDDPGMRFLLPVGRSGFAIAAGYAGLFSLIPIFAPLALLLGILAIWHLRRNPELHGMGRAVFGLVMGVLGTLFLIFILVAIAVNA